MNQLSAKLKLVPATAPDELEKLEAEFIEQEELVTGSCGSAMDAHEPSAAENEQLPETWFLITRYFVIVLSMTIQIIFF
ncbi:MAG TPA: hypothetical protein VFI73_13390 [Candidatus Nitrosopolaris sp.]|nr:hypothetical protein [Candidatus Nitrosopolaris sp.]